MLNRGIALSLLSWALVASACKQRGLAASGRQSAELPAGVTFPRTAYLAADIDANEALIETKMVELRWAQKGVDEHEAANPANITSAFRGGYDADLKRHRADRDRVLREIGELRSSRHLVPGVIVKLTAGDSARFLKYYKIFDSKYAGEQFVMPDPKFLLRCIKATQLCTVKLFGVESGAFPVHTWDDYTVSGYWKAQPVEGRPPLQRQGLSVTIPYNGNSFLHLDWSAMGSETDAVKTGFNFETMADGPKLSILGRRQGQHRDGALLGWTIGVYDAPERGPVVHAGKVTVEANATLDLPGAGDTEAAKASWSPLVAAPNAAIRKMPDSIQGYMIHLDADASDAIRRLYGTFGFYSVDGWQERQAWPAGTAPEAGVPVYVDMGHDFDGFSALGSECAGPQGTLGWAIKDKGRGCYIFVGAKHRGLRVESGYLTLTVRDVFRRVDPVSKQFADFGNGYYWHYFSKHPGPMVDKDDGNVTLHDLQDPSRGNLAVYIGGDQLQIFTGYDLNAVVIRAKM
jgi:hypothetical protein